MHIVWFILQKHLQDFKTLIFRGRGWSGGRSWVTWSTILGGGRRVALTVLGLRGGLGQRFLVRAGQ